MGQAFPGFAEVMRLAREIQAERFCDRGREMAEAASPATACLTQVQLTQLRWMLGQMPPRTYGRLKPVEPDRPPLEPQALHWRHFRVEEREDGWMRVVGFRPNPTTGEVERDTPEDAPWSPPPPGRWRPKLQLGSDGNPPGA